MGLLVYPKQMPTPQLPIAAKSGAPANDWYYLLLALFNRTGQGDGAPNIQPNLTAVVAPATLPLIAGDWNIFTTVPNGGAAQIPPLAAGADFLVFNLGANSLAVTPQATDTIDALAKGAAYNLAAGKMQWFRCTAPGQILSMQLG